MKLIIPIALLILFFNVFCDFTGSLTESSHLLGIITLSGKITGKDSGLPLSGSRVTLIGDNDTLFINADSIGNFSAPVYRGIPYELNFYSLKYADTNFVFIPMKDTTFSIKMSLIDYYPSSAGSYWKYVYQSMEPWIIIKYLIIEREIIANDGNIVQSKILLNGYITDGGQDTSSINDIIYTSEQFNPNGSTYSFINYIPQEYLYAPFAIRYVEINRFLHTGIFSSINNPSYLIPCSYLNGNIFNGIPYNNKVIKSDQSRDYSSPGGQGSSVNFIILADKIGIIELVDNYWSTAIGNFQIESSLHLLETNLMPN